MNLKGLVTSEIQRQISDTLLLFQEASGQKDAMADCCRQVLEDLDVIKRTLNHIINSNHQQIPNSSDESEDKSEEDKSDLKEFAERFEPTRDDTIGKVSRWLGKQLNRLPGPRLPSDVDASEYYGRVIQFILDSLSPYDEFRKLLDERPKTQVPQSQPTIPFIEESKESLESSIHRQSSVLLTSNAMDTNYHKVELAPVTHYDSESLRRYREIVYLVKLVVTSDEFADVTSNILHEIEALQGKLDQIASSIGGVATAADLTQCCSSMGQRFDDCSSEMRSLFDGIHQEISGSRITIQGSIATSEDAIKAYIDAQLSNKCSPISSSLSKLQSLIRRCS